MSNSALDLAQFIFVVWFFVLGAAIGSFLNVVVYRVPAGLSIALPGSHCPICKHAIRWYDNLPILSWLLLRARCRDCQASISMRYPIVEALTAGIFVFLAWNEVLRRDAIAVLLGDADLRGPAVLRFVGCLMHCGLLATLLAGTAIVADGVRASWKIFVPMLVVAIALPMIQADLRPVAAWPQLVGNAYRAPIDAACGLIVAAAMSGMAYAVSGRKRPTISGYVAGSLCVGATLGWQAIVLTAPICMAVDRLLAIVSPSLWRTRGSALALLTITSLAWIIAWAKLASLTGVR